MDVNRSAPRFAVSTRPYDDRTVVVSVRGEVDLTTAGALDSELRSAATETATRLVVDLTETTFFDSSAIRALLAGHARLQANGAELRVVCGNGIVDRVLGIVGVDRVVGLFPTIEQAAV